MSQNETHAEASWKILLSGRNGLLALTLTLGVTLQAINIYLSTTILPTVVEDIGGLSLYAWNTTLFIIASIIGAAISSRLLQQGVHFAYILSTVLLFLGCLIAAAAPNMPTMLVGRFLQGAGGGMFLALGYAMVSIVFAEVLWPRAFALISGMWGVATLIGPAVGGIFAEYGIWRAAFASMLPVLLVYIVLVLKILPASSALEDEEQVGVPLLQLIFLTISVLAISIASTANVLITQLVCLAASLMFFIFLIAQEKRAEHRLFPTDALNPSSTLFAIFLTIFLLLISVSGEIFLPYFLQSLHSQTPLLAGYVASMIAVGWAIAEMYCARFSDVGATRVIRYGPYAVLIGLAVLLYVVPETSTEVVKSASVISAALLLIGFGIGSAWPHLMTQIFLSTPGEEQKLAASSMTTVMMFASAVGSALAGMIANARGFNTSTELPVVSDTAFWMFTIFTLVSVVTLFSANSIVKRKPGVSHNH